jgi:hypothetical protein
MPRPSDWADVDDELARLLKQDEDSQEELAEENSRIDNLAWDASSEGTRKDLSAIQEDHSGELP